MIKTYVIDSSVIIQSPDALTRFQDNVVVVPFVVLEKLGALSPASRVSMPERQSKCLRFSG